MRERWKHLVRPEESELPASPDAGEAFGVWILGVVWVLACLWLGYLGSQWILPGIFIAGLLALWGWRHIEWLWWFPTVLVVATMLEPFAPLPIRGRFGPLVYIDLLTVGVAVVALVRSVGLSRPLLPRTPLDGLMLAVLGFLGLTLLYPRTHQHALIDLKQFVVRAVVFYATTTVASRPRGSRWVWIAFPLASGLIGIHAIVAALHGPGALAIQSGEADRIWGAHHGIFNTLLIALPVSAGLALNAGKPVARGIWTLASLCGALALVLYLTRTDVVRAPWLGVHHWTAPELLRLAFAWVLLLTLARLAWGVRDGRPHEGPRWLAVALTFVLFAAWELFGSALSGPAIPLVAVASGLVVGTMRADRRSRRRVRPRPQALEEAA